MSEEFWQSKVAEAAKERMSPEQFAALQKNDGPYTFSVNYDVPVPEGMHPYLRSTPEQLQALVANTKHAAEAMVAAINALDIGVSAAISDTSGSSPPQIDCTPGTAVIQQPLGQFFVTTANALLGQ